MTQFIICWLKEKRGEADHENEIMAAAKKLGYAKLREGQSAPINAVLDGCDSLVIYPTSFGKSAIMQIPALTRPKNLTIIFEPTVSLMYDQVMKLQSLGIEAEYLAHRNKEDHIQEFTKKYATERSRFCT